MHSQLNSWCKPHVPGGGGHGAVDGGDPVGGHGDRAGGCRDGLVGVQSRGGVEDHVARRGGDQL